MLGETVTRIRPGAQTGTDAFGQPVYGSDAETDIDGAMFAPGGSSEPVEVGREAVVTAPTLYFRGTWPDIVATDRIRVRGVEFAVDGKPADWRDPFGTGGPGGLVVTLKAVEG